MVPNPVISGFVQRIADSLGNFIRVAGERSESPCRCSTVSRRS